MDSPDTATPADGRQELPQAAPRIGRPPVTAADRRDILVRVLTTVEERQELRQAAASASMSVSTWMRAVALARARQMAKAVEEKRPHSDFDMS